MGMGGVELGSFWEACVGFGFVLGKTGGDWERFWRREWGLRGMGGV